MSDALQPCLLLLALLAGAPPRSAAAESPGARTNRSLAVLSLAVNGQTIAFRPGDKLRLSPSPRNVAFRFGPAPNSPSPPLRIRYKLDGFDEDWREVPGDMSIWVRFTDTNLEQVGEVGFRTIGQSDGWTGDVETSAFIHRRETLMVPPGAKGVWVAISSAGPPNAVGIFAISNLALARLPAGHAPAVTLLSWSGNSAGQLVGSTWTPTNWMRNGLRLAMARTTPLTPAHRALTLADDDPNAHAEWTTRKDAAPAVLPGQRLVLEWDEARSIGLAGPATATYPNLPAGFYRFRLNELSLAGLPREAETSLAFEVPLAVWKTPWFWGLVLLLCLSATAGAYRYVMWRHMRLQLARLESQRALEHERLRIARDIHDDLGARVTQMSLVSGLAQNDPTLPEKARADFNTLSAMARELVAALYETVWAVNPENDNLDALGNYICQMVDTLCEKAQLRRRFRVADLPRKVQVASNVRHDLVLAVKEAVHNVLKHARASEVSVQIEWNAGWLTIRIQDDGCGWVRGERPAGNGLVNMQRRLEQLDGHCKIESLPGQGTQVTFEARFLPPA